MKCSNCRKRATWKIFQDNNESWHLTGNLYDGMGEAYCTAHTIIEYHKAMMFNKLSNLSCSICEDQCHLIRRMFKKKL